MSKPQKARTNDIQRLSLLLCAAVSLSCAATAQPASAANWYVTNSGTGARDGKSWQSAWTSFAQINWSLIQSGDVIKIDAGSAPPPGTSRTMFYNGGLNVGCDNVTLEVSDEPGHNGASIAIQSVPTGINIGNRSNVTVRGGSKWKGYSTNTRPTFEVGSCQTGVYIGPAAKNITLENLDIGWCQDGLKIEGGQAMCAFLRLSENTTAVNYKAVSTSSNLQWCYLRNSWIRNSSATRQCVGVKTSGIPTNTGAVDLNLCILGPGLTTAVQSDSPMVDVNLASSLIINPSVASVAVTDAQHVNVNWCTSFMTPTNSKGLPHSGLSIKDTPNQYNTYVGASTFYGGVVNVPPAKKLLGTNYQYKTSGNVLALSTNQIDPLFVSNVGIIPGWYDFYKLCELDFAFQPGSPAAATRSAAFPTSVTKFLNDRSL